VVAVSFWIPDKVQFVPVYTEQLNLDPTYLRFGFCSSQKTLFPSVARLPLMNLTVRSFKPFIFWQGFSALEKMPWYVLRGQRSPSSRVWQPVAESNGRLAHLFKFELVGKARETTITICSWLSHPTRSLSRIVCRGQEGPEGSNGTLRPNFQANTWLRFFKLKANVSTRRRL
jgi:hypothetical protein